MGRLHDRDIHTPEYGSGTLTLDASGVASRSDHSFLTVLSTHPYEDRRDDRQTCGYGLTASAAVKVVRCNLQVSICRSCKGGMPHEAE